MTTKSRYDKLKQDREAYIQRARENALVTIPALMPPEGHSGTSPLPQPYQSVGARGVLTLASKAVMALMPPNESAFRLDIEEYTRAEISTDPKVFTEITQGLTMIERTTSRAIEAAGVRRAYTEAVSQLIVSGNCLIYVDPDMNLRVFSLPNFVIARDPSGKPLEMITREEVARAALPEDAAALVSKPGDKGVDSGPEVPVKSDTVELYTHLRREGNMWYVTQSVNDELIPGREGSHPVDACPWFALRWQQVDGEDYGRAHVDGIIGDLKSLEALSKAIVEFAAAAAKVIPLVNPNGLTDEDDLASAENFEFKPGMKEDVTFVQIEKYADFQVAKAMADDLTRRIEFFFLMNSSIQRQGERVTAEEIRYMAADLETTIGAVYVQLSQEFQLPLVRIALKNLTKKRRIPPLPKGLVEPLVTTGIDALSRQSDLTKLDRLVAGLRDLYGPEALASETNVNDYVKRRAAALGIDPAGLIKTEEQKAKEHEMRMQEEMMLRVGPQAVQQMGGMAQKGMEPDAG